MGMGHLYFRDSFAALWDYTRLACYVIAMVGILDIMLTKISGAKLVANM